MHYPNSRRATRVNIERRGVVIRIQAVVPRKCAFAGYVDRCTMVAGTRSSRGVAKASTARRGEPHGTACTLDARTIASVVPVYFILYIRKSSCVRIGLRIYFTHTVDVCGVENILYTGYSTATK